MRFLISVQRQTNTVGTCRSGTSVAARPIWRARRHLGVIVPLFFVVSCVYTFADTPVTFLRVQTRDLLQKEAVLKDGVKKDQALTALCDLYVVLRKDERYGDSEMLRQDAAKIRRRLINSAKQKSGKLKRSDVPRPTGLVGKVDAAIKQAIDEVDSDATTGGSTEKNRDGEPRLGGNAAAGAADSGWELVELMQRVIAPDFWEANGGPGAIHYFAMRRVLVVRATSDVHEQVRDLLRSLPR